MKTIAIIIGVSNYQDSAFERLPGAQADAGRFVSALASWGLPKEWTQLVLNEEATKAGLINTFYKNKFHFDADANLIVYFAGHGVRGNEMDQEMPESSLVLHDTKSSDPLATGLRLVELMQLIRSLKPAQVFLFIDACNLRLNRIDNPLDEEDILSTTNSKGLFCLLASGMQKSYEDVKLAYGYFTHALLKAIGEVRGGPQASCYDIVRKVSKTLREQALPLPEAYHIGSDILWPLQKSFERQSYVTPKESDPLVLRWDALAQLQDHLFTFPDPIIWVWGEGGIGKTVIAEQLGIKNRDVIYASVPSASNFANAAHYIIEQIRAQKNELFFNRPQESHLYHTLNHLEQHHPSSIIIIDHLDRLQEIELEEILVVIDSLSLPCILISRYSCPKNLFKQRKSKIIDWRAASLNLEEVKEMVRKSGLNPSYSPVLLNASGGNALRARHMLVKLLGQDIVVKGTIEKAYVNCMTALVACGGFLNDQLFCKTFKLDFKILVVLEKLGFIRYMKEGCFPHDLLIEMVEDHEWPLDLERACQYWNLQVRYTPHNRWACRSFILLASQMKDCRGYKRSLKLSLETLNEREDVNFLIDLAHISKREGWEDLLLQCIEYLIDHEQYLLAGELLSNLCTSSKRNLRNYAIKNEARRLLWIGHYDECVQMSMANLKNCRTPEVIYALNNTQALAHYFLGNWDQVVQLCQNNINYKGKKDERELGIAKHLLGVVMVFRCEDRLKTRELLEGSLKIFESTKSFIWTTVALTDLSLFYEVEGKWRQCLHYLNKSLEIGEALQNNTFCLYTIRGMARVYLRFFGIGSQELFSIVERLEILLSKVRESGENWVTVWALNTLATIYAHRKEIRKLEATLKEVIPLTMNCKECHTLTLHNAGMLAAFKNDMKKAKEHYRESFALLKELKHQYAIQEIKRDLQNCSLPLSLMEDLLKNNIS